ncbi:MAG TPA: beta-N-acetylglucosaminidase domain-containing protein [Verrucomicrobiae bacterium]
MKFPKLKWVVATVLFCFAGIGSFARSDTAETGVATSSLKVQLPSATLPFPEPLSTNQQPGFKFRGTKGWDWTSEQYLQEIPWLAKFKMNFLMNCYLSLFASNHPRINEWWKPLPDSTKRAFAGVIHSCQTNGIIFCFCMNPQLASERPLNPTNTEDLEDLTRHYLWAQSLGVKWFSICVDDVQWTQTPSVAAAQDAFMVNTILTRLRAQDPDAQMIFCPGPYFGDGTKPNDHLYLQTLARSLDARVYVFWTGDGDSAIAHRITVAAATSYKSAVNHRLFLWDNYPVNDEHETLNLGPVTGRAPDLCDVVDGYMSNPMTTQNQINRIPLATCADYAYNPWQYDPARSIGQAIRLVAETTGQQEVLRSLVEAYPGFLAAGGGPGTNPVRKKFHELKKEAGSRPALEFLNQMNTLSGQFRNEFPGEFDPEKKTVAADLAWMKAQP